MREEEGRRANRRIDERREEEGQDWRESGDKGRMGNGRVDEGMARTVQMRVEKLCRNYSAHSSRCRLKSVATCLLQ
jgi:hypothetical protein